MPNMEYKLKMTFSVITKNKAKVYSAVMDIIKNMPNNAVVIGPDVNAKTPFDKQITIMNNDAVVVIIIDHYESSVEGTIIIHGSLRQIMETAQKIQQILRQHGIMANAIFYTQYD